MTLLDSLPDAPATARFHRNAVEQIIQCVEDGVYCAILGPRLSGKTVLLRYVQQTLADRLGWVCVYIDLMSIRASSQQGFFADLMHQIEDHVCDLAGRDVLISSDQEISSAMFRGFLGECVVGLGHDLVLIIEHLESLPVDLVQALLTSLRAAYMDQQLMEQRVTVVVSGALSLATLTVGESSPFRGIARRVFIGDLSEADSQALIHEYLEKDGVTATINAQSLLFSATRGDPYLIRKLCQQGSQYVRESLSDRRLKARTVKRLIRNFLRDEVWKYAPLLEAVRLIEEDPDLLRCILMLLEQERVRMVNLPLPLSPDLDPLYLTGVVEKVEGDYYRIQNFIYRKFLAGYFIPGRVGRLLAMAGRWNLAIDYLETGIESGDEQSRADLLPAVINSIYASEDMSRAAHFLARGLSAFGIGEALVYFAFPGEPHLRLIGKMGSGEANILSEDQVINIKADLLEARAFRQEVSLRGAERSNHVKRAIPLVVPGRRPVGIVSLVDDLFGDRLIEQRERDQNIVGYLSQASRALNTVVTRRQELLLAGRMQASLLPESVPVVDDWQLTAYWRPARETSGDFYDFIQFPDGRIGFVLADVTDKGMGAALFMALSRTLLRTYASEYSTRPDLVMQTANHRVLTDTHGGLFITVFYGVFNPVNGELTYCNAGHHPAYLIRAEGGVSEENLSRTGIPLGVNDDASWGNKQIIMQPGDVLLLYTDGIVEAQNDDKELFGEGRMLEVLRRFRKRDAKDIEDALLSSVYDFAGDSPQFDDITLMVIKREISVESSGTLKII